MTRYITIRMRLIVTAMIILFSNEVFAGSDVPVQSFFSHKVVYGMPYSTHIDTDQLLEDCQKRGGKLTGGSACDDKRGGGCIAAAVFICEFGYKPEAVDAKYYELLSRDCKEDACCLSSIKRMSEVGGYAIARFIGRCPDGYIRQMLECADSYQWCQESVYIPILAEFSHKIVYAGTPDSLDRNVLFEDCQKRGGRLNDCGTLCDDSRQDQGCAAVCAMTCELGEQLHVPSLTPKRPKTPVDDFKAGPVLENYKALREACQENSCCLSSVDSMEKVGGYRINVGACLFGYHINMLKCEESYRWCEPR